MLYPLSYARLLNCLLRMRILQAFHATEKRVKRAEFMLNRANFDSVGAPLHNQMPTEFPQLLVLQTLPDS